MSEKSKRKSLEDQVKRLGLTFVLSCHWGDIKKANQTLVEYNRALSQLKDIAPNVYGKWEMVPSL